MYEIKLGREKNLSDAYQYLANKYVIKESKHTKKED